MRTLAVSGRACSRGTWRTWPSDTHSLLAAAAPAHTPGPRRRSPPAAPPGGTDSPQRPPTAARAAPCRRLQQGATRWAGGRVAVGGSMQVACHAGCARPSKHAAAPHRKQEARTPQQPRHVLHDRVRPVQRLQQREEQEDLRGAGWRVGGRATAARGRSSWLWAAGGQGQRSWSTGRQQSAARRSVTAGAAGRAGRAGTAGAAPGCSWPAACSPRSCSRR